MKRALSMYIKIDSIMNINVIVNKFNYYDNILLQSEKGNEKEKITIIVNSLFTLFARRDIDEL